MTPQSFTSSRRQLLRHFAVAALLTTAQLSLGAATLPAGYLPPLPAGAFTIVIIPDTQGYVGKGTKATPTLQSPVTNIVFANHVRWIREHLREQNIAFVSQVGDIVDIDNETQWQLARQNMDVLHGLVPYGIAVGNHDMKVSGDAALFQHYFPAERYRGFKWYGGTFESSNEGEKHFGNNVNSFQLFSAGGMDFVFLHLECNAPDPVLAWASEILKRHVNRRAFISTHMDLGVIDKPKTDEGFSKDPQGRMRWSKIHRERGNTPEQMWEKLYRKHANLGFVFCGDQSRVTALHLTDIGDHGNTVHRLLSDYTSSGPLRLYRFLPAEDKVQVITYDTTMLQMTEATKYKSDRTSHQFSVEYRMSAIPPAKP